MALIATEETLDKLFDGYKTYIVPKYQRPYQWSEDQWNDLYDDIMSNEPGWFIGTIIGIKDSGDENKIEIVDGQQRLISVFLLYLALYKIALEIDFDKKDSTNNKNKMELVFKVKRDLCRKKDNEDISLIPQEQGENRNDFFTLLSDMKIKSFQCKKNNYKLRKIYKGYKKFCQRLEKDLEAKKKNERFDFIYKAYDKLQQVTLLKVVVDDASMAYQLFETINARGLPLSAIDLIKNKMFSALEKTTNKKALNSYANKWSEILECLGDDSSKAKRFLQQNYNAFRKEINKSVSKGMICNDEFPLGPTATQGRLIKIYFKMIEASPAETLSCLLENSRIYAKIIATHPSSSKKTDRYLTDLIRVHGVPSYSLLLFLFKYHDKLQLNSNDLNKIVKMLVNYFLRRNLTDIPPTNTMIKKFQDIISLLDCFTLKGSDVYDKILSQLKNGISSDELFKDSLRGRIYEDNPEVARFILCALAEKGMTKENHVDLWETEKGKPIWTIEHILPKGENIPKPWVDMIANGNTTKAKDIKSRCVHKLGNLTLTAYNSNLGTRSFAEKKNRVDENKRKIGYNNGLIINQDVYKQKKWTEQQINKRTEKLVNDVFNLFKL